MSDYTELIQRLRNRCWLEAADALTAQAREIANLKTVMIAAAEEISDHWDAHCDAEGYGPANLMRRLEDGIPSEYGYTAGAFAKQARELEALRADAERLRSKNDALRNTLAAIKSHCQPQPSALAAAIVATCDAAMQAGKAVDIAGYGREGGDTVSLNEKGNRPA